MKQYRWVPVTLNGLYPNGTRWELQSLSESPGYWKFEGKVCLWPSGAYVSKCGEYKTMREAAKAVYAAALLSK